MAGQKEKAREIIKRMEDLDGADIANLYGSIGYVYLGLGEWDTAYKYYEKGIGNREQQILWAKFVWRIFPEFLAQPRTKELLERIEARF